MAMYKRNLIDYLPPFMQDYLELKHIMAAEQPEFENFWTACENGMADKCVDSATEDGVARWESIYKITPKGTDTLEERKFRLTTKMNQGLPYTMTKLRETLSVICGAGNFAINLQPANYHIEIKLALANINNYQEVVDVLAKMIPANLTQNVQVMYNKNELFSQFTHAELAEYTHKQLKERMFE